jgi:lysophospholipase L1-like esterase
MKSNSILMKAGMVVASILLSLFLAELVLRVIYPAQTRYYVWQPNLQHTFYPDTTVLKGLHSPAHFTINSYGVRTDLDQIKLEKLLFLPPNKRDSVSGTQYYICLGGSTTECLYLDDNATWPNQLARLSSINNIHNYLWMGNIGKSGCTTRENYIQLKYCVSQYKVMSGVVLMAGLNDMLKRLSRDSLYPADFRFSPTLEDSLANTILLKQGRNTGTTWWRRTAVFYLLQQAFHQNSPQGVEWENVEDDHGEIYKTWRANRQHASKIIDSLPNLTPALSEFERNLNLIIDEARKQHLRIVFVNQAALWKDSMSDDELKLLWMGGIGNFQQAVPSAYYSPAALRRALNLYNEKLKDVCHDNGVEMVDLDANLPHDASIFYDDCHFTELGAKKAAAVIYKAINLPIGVRHLSKAKSQA